MDGYGKYNSNMAWRTNMLQQYIAKKRRQLARITSKQHRTFSAHDLSDHIVKLCRERKNIDARNYFISDMQRLLNSRIHPAEKINHVLYLSQLIQSGTGAKHGHGKLLKKAQIIMRHLEKHDTLPAGFLDFGCGPHDPLALATLHYLNGYHPCHAIDLRAPNNEVYSALSMYDILANIVCFPERYCFKGTNVQDLVKRVSHFRLDAFESGDFWVGFEKVRSKVRLEIGDVSVSDIEESSLSRAVSFAVLEHVADLDAVCQKLHKIIKPGGVVFHFVDLVDHRSYTPGSKFNSFSFLAEEHAPKGMNRLRASEVREAHERCGFEILVDRRENDAIPHTTRRRLLPKYREMRVDDVSATIQRLVVRRT